jgi:hypothetical protein
MISSSSSTLKPLILNYLEKEKRDVTMGFKNNILTASLTKFGTGTKLRTGHCPEEHQQVTLLQTEEWNPQVMSGMTLLQTEERNPQ